LAPFRRFWSAHVDALERHLDRLAQPTATKSKAQKSERAANSERPKGDRK
jgi:hypothetical protein